MARRWWRTGVAEARHAVGQRLAGRRRRHVRSRAAGRRLQPWFAGCAPRRSAATAGWWTTSWCRDRARAARAQRAVAGRDLRVRPRPADRRSRGAGTGLGCAPCEVTRDPPRGAPAARARRARGRARLLRRDLPRERPGRARRSRRLRAGQPLPLEPRRGARHPLLGRRGPGQARAAARADRYSTWWWTSGADRPPSASGRATSSTIAPCASCTCRSASGTASA